MPARSFSHSVVAGARLGFLCALLASTLAAQPQPAHEVYLLAGASSHGGLLLSPQANTPPAQWRPAIGGGALVRLGRSWGVLADVTTSSLRTYWKWDNQPGAGPSDNSTHIRRVSVLPSVVRLWPRARFSVYAGGGFGLEFDREDARFRPIVARDQRGQPVLAGEFTSARYSKIHPAPALRAGVILPVRPRLTLRAGYSYLRQYIDERGSHVLEVGIGYR